MKNIDFCLKEISLRLNEIRIEQGLSFEDLSILTDIDKSNLVKILSHQKNYTAETLMKIAFGLNTRIIDIFDFCNDCNKNYCNN